MNFLLERIIYIYYIIQRFVSFKKKNDEYDIMPTKIKVVVNDTNKYYDDNWGHFIDLEEIYDKSHKNKPIITINFDLYVIPNYNYENNKMSKQFVRKKIFN